MGIDAMNWQETRETLRFLEVGGRAHRGRQLLSALLAAMAFGGCDETPTTVVRLEPARIIVLGGDGQAAQAGEALPIALNVRVTDREGRGVPSVAVQWAVVTGGGSVAPASEFTDGNGEVKASWTLGTVPGSQRVTAAVFGLPLASFEATARPAPAVALRLVSGDAQTGKILAPLGAPIVVRVVDAFGNGVAGESVTWSSTDSLGSVSPGTSVSNDEGLVSTRWTPRSLGANSVLAEAKGIDPVTFTATAEMLHFTDISAGLIHTCALDEMGRVLCWGADFWTLGRGWPSPARSYCVTPNAFGPCEWLPTPVDGPFTYTALGSGVEHDTCGLSDGMVVCWGASLDPTPAVVQPSPRFVDVGKGDAYACGLTAEATVLCWGSNERGVLGNPDIANTCPDHRCGSLLVPVVGLEGVRRLAVGPFHACALLQDGELRCWGDNGWGNLGVAVRQTDLCAKANKCEPLPVPVSTDLRFSDVAVGGFYSCGLSTAGKVYCWGANTVEQLGGSSLSEPVVSDRLFRSLAAGSGHMCALDSEGAAYCWGWNMRRQLGDGATTAATRATAAPVAGGIRWAQLSPGEHHTCGISMEGLVYCWGGNGMLQSGQPVPTNLATPVPLLAGGG